MEINTIIPTPGKPTKEKNWATWNATLTNNLTVLPGTTGISLAYVIRQNEVLVAITSYLTFDDNIIDKDTLPGRVFDNDSHGVH